MGKQSCALQLFPSSHSAAPLGLQGLGTAELGPFSSSVDVCEGMIWTEPLRAPDATTRMQIHGSQGKRPQAGRAAQGCSVLETGLVCLCRNLFLPFSVSLCLFLVSPVVTQTQP